MDFMKIAIREARTGMKKHHGGPFGAVIVKDGKIIAKAHNMVLSTNDPTAHAEIVAIRKATKKLGTFKLNDCEIYSTAQPCPMCLSAIVWARIKALYFGANAEDATKIGFDDSNIYEMIKGKKSFPFTQNQIKREECLSLFDEWMNMEHQNY